MMRLAAIAWAGLIALAGGARLDEGTKAEDLVGTWSMVSVSKGGETKSGDEVSGQTCVFTKETLTQELAGMRFAYKFSVDATKNPSRIALEVTESPFGAGSKADGIIEVKGDEMKLAYSTDGGRPETFDPDKAGADVRICVLKRKK